MTALRNRMTAVIKYYGDSFTVGGTSATGIFTPFGREKAKQYLTDAEVGAAAIPVYAAYVPHDDATVVAATVAWNGLALTVKRVLNLRLKNVTIAKMLVLV